MKGLDNLEYDFVIQTMAGQDYCDLEYYFVFSAKMTHTMASGPFAWRSILRLQLTTDLQETHEEIASDHCKDGDAGCWSSNDIILMDKDGSKSMDLSPQGSSSKAYWLLVSCTFLVYAHWDKVWVHFVDGGQEE